MPPALQIRGLTKRYGARTVVDDVTFDVAEGTVVCLLGRNGAGKTTTVECAEGFRRPDAGTVRVLGADPVADRPSVAGRIGVMLQEGGAYQAATPREMLRLYAALYERPADVEEILATVELLERGDSRLRSLSGGEKQRLNLALALVGRPDLYFLDEPTAGMDTASRHRTWDVIDGLRRDGAAVLLTTHYIDEAERLADQVAVLHQGRLLAFDSVAGVAGDADGLMVTIGEPVDPAGLAAALSVPVTSVGSNRLRVAAGPDRIPHVTAWFAEQGLALQGVAVDRPSLEDAFLALTGEPAEDAR